MTDQEILTKAVEQAIANGWARYDQDDVQAIVEAIYKTSGAVMDGPHFWSGLIYSHSFARALWGGDYLTSVTTKEGVRTALSAWQYHLQQMVIADDPIQYLGDHLPAH